MRPGDRIELVAMADDPAPIAPEERGNVERVNESDLGDGPFLQLWVKWDSGRSLMPCIPPGVVRVVTDE